MNYYLLCRSQEFWLAVIVRLRFADVGHPAEIFPVACSCYLHSLHLLDLISVCF